MLQRVELQKCLNLRCKHRIKKPKILETSISKIFPIIMNKECFCSDCKKILENQKKRYMKKNKYYYFEKQETLKK